MFSQVGRLGIEPRTRRLKALNSAGLLDAAGIVSARHSDSRPAAMAGDRRRTATETATRRRSDTGMYLPVRQGASPVSVSSPYIGWTPLLHADGCRASGWLAHERRSWDGRRLELRLVCPGCGAAHVATMGSPAGDVAPTRETTTTRRLGFGCPPVRTTGLWLWPGTTGPDAVGPSGYVATMDANRPNGRNAIRGLVSRYRTKRGAIRWAASVDCDPATEARDGFRSVRAAARWLAGRLTGGAVAEPDGGPDGAGAGR